MRISKPEQEAVGAITLADDGVPAEHEGGGALLGARQLAEDDPHHARLDHHPHDRLKVFSEFVLTRRWKS